MDQNKSLFIAVVVESVNKFHNCIGNIEEVESQLHIRSGRPQNELEAWQYCLNKRWRI